MGKQFSIKGLHNKLDETVIRLNKEGKTRKREELLGLIKALRANTPCPQQMVIDLGT
jgi:hypothetical protein